MTSVDADYPVQSPLKLRNSKCCSVSRLIVIEYESDLQRLWSDCAYAQADLSLCWSHIPHCWKSHAVCQGRKLRVKLLSGERVVMINTTFLINVLQMFWKLLHFRCSRVYTLNDCLARGVATIYAKLHLDTHLTRKIEDLTWVLMFYWFY